jgi:hypothetical protein
VRATAGLIGSGLVVVACATAIAALGPLRARLELFVGLFLLAFVAYVAASWLALRGAPAPGWGWSGPVVAIGLLARLPLLAAEPTLSDDPYRYVWEGRVLAAGFSPYQYAPSAAELAPLRDDAIWARVNNRDVPSPYPPAAQVAGLVGWWLTPSATHGAKLVATAADLATLGALALLLRGLGLPPIRLLLYAWHPMVLIAFSHSGHNDALMVAPLVLALALTVRGARWRPAVLVALAALAKVTPILLLPLLARRLGWWPASLVPLLMVAAYAPLLALGGGATGSLVTYLGTWSDNDSIHAILRLAIGPAAAKATCLAALAATVAALVLHPGLRQRPLWWQSFVALAAAILLSPTVHAWYLTWLVPLLTVGLQATGRAPFLAPLSSLGWLLLSGLVVLPYLTYDTHQWQLWISLAEYLPLFGLLLLSALANTPRRRSPALAWRYTTPDRGSDSDRRGT